MTDHHDALDRYLDDFANGKTVTTSAIQPELADTIHRVAEIGSMPLPDTTFVDLLEDKLMNAVSTAPTSLKPPLRVLDRGGFAPRAAGRVDSAARFEPNARRWVPLLLVAALVILALAVTFGPLSPGGDGNSGNHAAGPAVYAPAASPSPEALAGETVLAFTLPAEAIPIADTLAMGLEHLTIPPGMSGSWEQGCCPGASVEYIISGSYTVTAEDAVQVVRGNGEVEEVPAGTEVTLEGGDSLIARVETPLRGANNGTEPTELVSWNLIDSTDDATFSGRMQSEWREGNFQVQRLDPLPAVEAVIELHRFTVEDGDVIPAAGDVTLRVGIGQGILVNRMDGAVTLTSQAVPPATVYVLTFTQPGARDGTPEARIQE
jgi:hypothetical protein